MKRKGLIVGLILIVGCIGTALGVVYVRFANLPHPKEASHNQLMYWVVLRDLKEYEPEIHLALVNRFAAEAKEIFDKNNASEAQLSVSQSNRLLANIEILKKVWFENRIAQYCDIENPETCEVFMDRQIQLLDDFGNIAFEHANVLYPDKATENLTTISDELFDDIDKWIEETPLQNKEATLQAIREATVFWLSTEDLSQQVMEARKELACRVTAELEKGMDLSTTTSIVSDDRAKQLKSNAMLLMEGWIHVLAEQYAELPQDEKKSFVEEKINKVRDWKLLEYLNSDSESKTNSMQSMTEFNRIITAWTERAPQKLRGKIRKLHAAFQQRIFLMMLNGNR